MISIKTMNVFGGIPCSNDGRSSNGVYQRVMGNRAKLNTQTQLTYNKVIAEKHTLDALLALKQKITNMIMYMLTETPIHLICRK